MKKLFALLAVVLAVVSCQKDADLGVNVGGEQLVNITVALPEETRATSADSGWDNTNATLRVIFQVYDENGNTNLKLRQEKELPHSATSVNFDVRLVPGRDYTFVAWADQGEGYFNVDDLTEVTFVKDSWRAMDEVRDAYTATQLIPAGQSIPNVTLTLTRPFAKVRVVTTDMDAIKDLKLEVNNAVVEYSVALPNAFNAFSGEVVEGALQNNVKHTYKYSYNYVYKYNENENEKTLFADYILVPANDVVKFNLKVYDAEKLIRENSFTTDIPVERNKLTTIKGNILTDGSGIKVEVEDKFEQPGNEIEVVEVATADALIAALNTPNAEVVLTTDITLDQPLSITSNATIDGNGNAFIYTGNGDRVIDIRDIATRTANNGTVVTIKNLSIDLGNKSYERGINYNSNGKLILDNVKVVGTDVTYALNLPGLSDNCEVEINNCEFKGIIALNVWGENAVINVNNSILTSVDNSTAEDYAAINLNKDAEGTVVNVNGGKIIAKNENGEPSAASNNATVSGKINISKTTEVIGYKLFPVATVTYTTTDDYYTCTTLQDAIDKAAETPSTATVTLIKDIESSEIITVSGKATINGNGHTITSSAGRAINVSGAEDVTIKNLTIAASGERAINVIQNSKKVTIENVTATAANYTVNVASSAPGAVVAIKNTTLNGLCTVNVSSAGAVVTVDGSTVNCNDNNTTVGESYAALSLNKEAVGGKIIATNSTINVTEGSDSTKGRNGAEDGEVTINGGVEGVAVTKAVITYPGSDYYYGFETIQEAVEFAKAGETVGLIRDVTTTETISLDKNITIDLNDKTLSTNSTQKVIIIKNEGTTPISVNIQNGEIINNAKGSRCVDTRSGNINLTLDGVKMKSEGYKANGNYAQPLTIGGSGKDINVTINNSRIDTDYYAIMTFNPAVITLDNTVLNGYTTVYFKPASGSLGSKGTIFNVTNGSVINGVNNIAGESNASSAFQFADTGVSVYIDATSTITAAANENYQYFFIIGNEVDKAKVDTATVRIEDGATLTATGKDEYKGFLYINNGQPDAKPQFSANMAQTLKNEGWVVSEAVDGLVTVTGK